MSKVPNVSNPSFSDEEALQIIRDAGYGIFIDEYKRVSTGTGNDNQGFWGFWTRQIAGVGVQNPIIFYNELYSFVKGGNKWSCVISWKYDTERNLINEPHVTPFPDVSGPNVIKEFRSGTKIYNQYNVIGEFDSFNAAQEKVKEDLEKFKDIE